MNAYCNFHEDEYWMLEPPIIQYLLSMVCKQEVQDKGRSIDSIRSIDVWNSYCTGGDNVNGTNGTRLVLTTDLAREVFH